MSIISEAAGFGWVLDHKRIIESDLKPNSDSQQITESTETKPHGMRTIQSHESKTYRCNSKLFHIINKFMMDSEFDAHKRREMTTPTDKESKPPKKKRKRICQFNEGELEAIAYDTKVRSIISKAHDQLLEVSRKHALFSPRQSTEGLDNNCEARAAAQTEGSGQKLRQFCEEQYSMRLQKNDIAFSRGLIPTQSECCLEGQNPNKECVPLKLLGETYFIPPLSQFLLSDISAVGNLVTETSKNGYDVVIIDPPWENKSVKRLKSYAALKNTDTFDLPVPQLTHPGSLVVVWVTNKQREHRFVRNELFPKWNIEFITQWFWLKVTKYGEVVYDLNSIHKKPYEVLLIGKVGTIDGAIRVDEATRHDCDIPQEQVIMSVPCSIPSRKPPLAEVLKPFCPPDPKCLELFARNLQKGWTSWGNEVLKYQHEDFFVSEQS